METVSELKQREHYKPAFSRDYQLVIKVPFEALDDIQARDIANGLLNISPKTEGTVSKLQRVFENKPPMGVILK